MKPTAIMQLCDSLAPGGMERVAVTIANRLPRDRFQAHLGTTRTDGLLSAALAKDVRRLRLRRQFGADPLAIMRLSGYLHQGRVRLVHAHGTALFVAVAASLLPPWPRVVWHDHYGRGEIEPRPARPYRWAARRVAGVIAVNESLADWARRQLAVPAERVWYLPNFVAEPSPQPAEERLAGTTGARLVCVANFRREKDHPNLLAAMREVVRRVPAAHLFLVGNGGDAAYTDRVQALLQQPGLAGHVTWLGTRPEVAGVLQHCDIGVLSSVSEGLPLALIEYGMHGLAAVATDVGQCAEVLDQGRAGLLVPAAAPGPLAAALIELLESPARRAQLGRCFQERARAQYSVQAGMERLLRIYQGVLGVA